MSKLTSSKLLRKIFATLCFISILQVANFTIFLKPVFANETNVGYPTITTDNPKASDFDLDFLAAEPSTYDHSVGGGEYDGRVIGVNVVEQLNGGDFVEGEQVSFFDAVKVTGSFDTGPASLHIINKFGNISVNNHPVGFDALDEVVLNSFDTGNEDPNGNASVTNESFGIEDDYLIVEYDLDGLDVDDQIIVRIDVILYNNIVGNVQNALVQSRLESVTINGCEGQQCSVGLGQQTVPLQPGEDVVQYGSISISKATDPSDDTSTNFSFTGDLGDFVLTGNGDSEVFTDLLPGIYTVSELETDGWQLNAINCTGDLDAGSISLANGISIDLDSGEDIVCTFYNQTSVGETASIQVTKYTVPQGSQQLFEFTLEGESSDNALLGDNQTHYFEGLAPGEYNLEETVIEGWELASATCNGEAFSNGGTITLEAGEDISCVFINSEMAPETADLSIVKSDNQDPVNAGDNLIYTLYVHNAGPAVGEDVVVTDTWPSQVSFLSATSTKGSCSYDGGLEITCSLGAMDVGEAVTITITVSTTTPGSLTNEALVKSLTLDPNEDNNQDTEETLIIAQQDGGEVLGEETSRIEDGDVLGASTSLAVTGGNKVRTIWLVSFFLLITLILVNSYRKFATLLKFKK